MDFRICEQAWALSSGVFEKCLCVGDYVFAGLVGLGVCALWGSDLGFV